MAGRNNADATADPRAIVTTRLIDAPRALVFEAWTDPRHLSQWWGPTGFTTTTKSFEFRPGGVWRFVMHGPDGRDYQNRITFEDIVAPERLVYRHGGGDDVEPMQSRMTVTFEDEVGMTRLTMRMVFSTAEERERIVREYGAVEGARQTVGRLAGYMLQFAPNGSERPQFVFETTRIFKAPRDLVWKAWTDPQCVAQWWGPHGFTNPVCEMDVRPGGQWHVEQRAPDGTRHVFRGEFLEVDAPARLVNTQRYFDHAPIIVVVTFEDGDSETRVTTTVYFASKADLDATLSAGMEWGMGQSHARLDALLAKMDSSNAQ